MHDDSPESRPLAPRAQPALPPTEAELSRIAREAVHQPADARLDKQLIRLGLMDAAETTAPAATEPAARPAAADPELVRLREDLRRMRILLAFLVAVIAVLAIVVIVLLVR
jgi:hypothetical protein